MELLNIILQIGYIKMSIDRVLQPWWLQSQSVNLSEAKGLSSKEAKLRLAKFGPNLLGTRQADSLILQYLSRFKNPLVIILLVASIVSAFTGEVTNFVIIISMIFLSVTLDFVQEHRANASAEKLRLSVALRAVVIRDQNPTEVAVSKLVPGDVVMLSAGNLIPADGILIDANDFFVKQAILTGEPYPVEKKAGKLPDSATDILEASNAVFMGTTVVSGSACMLVIKTGQYTDLGAIADSIAQSSAQTSFETSTRRFGMLIMRLTILMVMFVLLVNTLSHKSWPDSFLFAIALAVGLTPELLPMVISVTLSRGAIHMSKKKVIVKRLSAIQDLGSMDVLCTDKTGTLTEAKIHLEAHVDSMGVSSNRVLELAYLNSFFETGLKSPLDEAILEHEHIDVSGWRKIDEVPFDFERRRVSVLIDNGETRWLVVKGAPDDIIGLCTHYENDGPLSQHEMDKTVRMVIHDQYNALEKEGYRVLGIAWREVPTNHPHAVVSDESGLVLAGFAGFLDPPKASAASALAAIRQSGVVIKIVTGDSELVTQHVCTQLNIPVTGVLTGKDIAQMDDIGLQAKVELVNLFCRVNPTQKERVIRAIKARGHVVGYLGDGINDAPSLHVADVGLSVDSAVDVAKEAADMILLQQDLHVLHAAILEGRRTFANVMKYIMMATSSNFGNMFSMAGASLFLPFLPMMPTQILLNNILYDISEMPIPLDKVDAEEVAVPHVLDLNFIRNFMLVIGPISSLFDLMTFYVMLVMLQANEKLFQTGWFVESLCTQVLVIFIIRTRYSPLRSLANPLLTFTSLLVVTIAILIPFTPLGIHFGFVPPPAKFYFILGGMVIAYLFIVEVVKQAFYKWWESRGQLKRR
ncbi:MAG TPA: magnesium-translocating P-type ATPase [Methylophilaceae bacterium]|nr:magnesium-translocating P-type ATPase [Methylophilaceae bacterium]